MKLFFTAAMAVIIVISASFIGYGVYLNKVSDSHIETMMATRSVSVHGFRASFREITPEIVLEAITLRAENMADVVAHIDGAVSGMLVSAGQFVKKGQKLCVLANSDISLQMARADTDTARADAAYVQALGELDRNRRLVEKNSISKSELESSEARMKSARAELDAAKIARRQLDQQSGLQTVTSPTDGFVVVIYQHAGAYVQKGAPVMLVGNFNKLILRGQILDEKIRNISPTDGVYSIKMDMSFLSEKALDTVIRGGFGKEFVINARIVGITPPVEESAPLRSVTWELDNALGLLEPGLYTGVPVSVNAPKRVLAVPSALIENIVRPELYVADADSRLAVRGVSTGVYGGGFTEITEGLREGDVVITSGVDGLEPGTRLDVLMGGA
ncbi:MAG: efflux RND transporter periplasmic adaptor subunit [Synergistaceae bacterium]|jgi:RND family efflux transporter MFP subunit|nr:efflux RND transporter periplasmic adaptor subunit [Synergistaceae bacterium]